MSVMSGCSSSAFFCLHIYVLSGILFSNDSSDFNSDLGSGSDLALCGESLG